MFGWVGWWRDRWMIKTNGPEFMGSKCTLMCSDIRIYCCRDELLLHSQLSNENFPTSSAPSWASASLPLPLHSWRWVERGWFTLLRAPNSTRPFRTSHGRRLWPVCIWELVTIIIGIVGVWKALEMIKREEPDLFPCHSTISEIFFDTVQLGNKNETWGAGAVSKVVRHCPR